MITHEQLQGLLTAGGSIYDQAGKKIGDIRSTDVSPGAGNPRWVSFTVGVFGHDTTFAPLDEATIHGDDIHLPYSKEIIKDAPRSDDGSLTKPLTAELIKHYDLNADGTEPPLFD